MTIVTAVDRSGQNESVVEEAIKLAEAFGEDIHVVHVLNRSDFVKLERTELERSGQPVDLEQIRTAAESIAREAINESNASEDVTAVGLIGEVPVEILRHATEENARYIVLGGRKRSPVGKVVFGSVTQSVLLGAAMPVVAVMEPDSE